MNAPSIVFGVDPNDLRIPEAFSPPSGDAGEVVALVAEEGARQAGWAARLAVKLAREWASGGFRVFLADGDLSEASLHGVVGVANAEGLADVIVHGASPGRVVQRVEGSRFLFASAGTVVADPARVYDHPRWATVLSAFRESGSVLLLYLPSEAGTAGLIAQADRVLRLANAPPGDDEELETGVTVLHAEGVGPATGEPAVESVSVDADPASGAPEEGVADPSPVPDMEPVPSEPAGSEAPDAPQDVPTGSVAGSEEAAPSGDPGDAPASDPAPGPDEPTWPEAAARRPEPARGNRLRLILLVILLLAAALFLGEWLGYLDLPGLTSWLGAGASHSIASG